MKLVRKGLIGLGGLTLAVAPVALSAATFGSSAGAQVIEPVEPIVVPFTEVGAHDYMVPEDARCIEVVAIGAQGGHEGGEGSIGGLGGSVEEMIQVLPGQTLQVNVGGRGGDGDDQTGAGGAGGFNGGGAGGTATGGDFSAGGGGGGGASDVRQGGTTLADRAIVAAGGGGGSAISTNGGSGGNPGEAGQDGTGDQPSPELGGGGATISAPGAGGVSGSNPGVGDGQAGTSGAGGTGGGGSNGDIVGGGGGGGGGYYGGGGGAAVGAGNSEPGGGGGGSNYIASEGAGGATGVDADNNGNGRVTLSYVPGNTDCVLAPLTIVKQTAGATAPFGTEFTVQVQCLDDTIDLGSVGKAGVASSVDLTYTVGGEGVAHPTAGYTLSFTGSNECTVIETNAGGAAATTYACSGSGALRGDAVSAESWDVSDAAAVTPDDPCTAAGPQTDPIVVNIIAPGQEATVTIENTFAAAAAAVTPRFTG